MSENHQDNSEYLKEKIISILKSHGIKMMVGGCGCCESPWVSFEYKGELLIEEGDNFNFNMFEEEKE